MEVHIMFHPDEVGKEVHERTVLQASRNLKISKYHWKNLIERARIEAFLIYSGLKPNYLPDIIKWFWVQQRLNSRTLYWVLAFHIVLKNMSARVGCGILRANWR